MGSGKYRDRIEIQQQAVSTDVAGQRVLTWTTYDEVWANVLLPNGKEMIASDRENSIVSGSMRIRFRKDITAGMRVLWSDMIFGIKAVLPDTDKREHIDLVVETGANDG